ncbi:MAG: hypothetical protein ABIG31_05715 [Candidatus Omnitrophota bacterium]
MQKIISKRERIVFIVTLGVVVFSIVFTFLIGPLLKRAQILNKEIQRARLKLKKYVRLLNHEAQIKDKYAQFASRQHLSVKAEDAAVSSLSILEALAKEANIRIIDIRPQAPRAVALYRETVIDLRTEGTMEGYLKFLYSIENSLTLLNIKRFQLNAKPNTQLLEGSFSISQLSLSE